MVATRDVATLVDLVEQSGDERTNIEDLDERSLARLVQNICGPWLAGTAEV